MSNLYQIAAILFLNACGDKEEDTAAPEEEIVDSGQEEDTSEGEDTAEEGEE